jgi:hypothetical protein
MPKYPFIFGALLAAIGWAIAWPERVLPSGTVIQPESYVPRLPVRSPEQLRDLIDQLNDSSDRLRQCAAARELEGVKSSEIHDSLLGMVGEFDRFNFPVAAKLLLIELARRDPEEAVAWSWGNLREARGWAHAFDQIGPQWAWDDPEGFSQFVKKHLRENSSQRNLTMKDLLASAEPILSEAETIDAQFWLLKSSPRLAFDVVRQHNNWARRSEMVSALSSKADFESALSAWDDYDPKEERRVREAYDAAAAEVDSKKVESEQRDILRGLELDLNKVRHPSLDSTVKAIVKRWKLTNSEEFEESSYSAWDKTR